MEREAGQLEAFHVHFYAYSLHLDQEGVGFIGGLGFFAAHHNHASYVAHWGPGDGQETARASHGEGPAKGPGRAGQRGRGITGVGASRPATSVSEWWEGA